MIKSTIVVAPTFSNNSLGDLHVKYFARIFFRLQHSSRIWLTVAEDLHSLHSGWLSLVSRCLWVTRVWPMWSLVRITASRRLRSVVLLSEADYWCWVIWWEYGNPSVSFYCFIFWSQMPNTKRFRVNEVHSILDILESDPDFLPANLYVHSTATKWPSKQWWRH